MNKHEYAAAAVEETSRYDGYTSEIEPVDVKLPSTKLGAAARAKALAEGRVFTNKTARIGGEAPLLRGERKAGG